MEKNTDNITVNTVVANVEMNKTTKDMFDIEDSRRIKIVEGEEDEEVTKAAAKGESEIIIAKHRNGPVGTVKLLFQGNITKFKNPIKTDAF